MEKCSKNSILWIQRHWSISAMCYIAAQSASAMVWLCCSSTMPNSLQNQYSFSFAFTIFCISSLNMSTSQHVHNSDNVPPPQRIVAYICMNPNFQNAKKCLQIYSVTISTAIMQETWGHCVRAWQCVEKSLRRDALAWRLQWSGAFHPKASNAHAFAYSARLRHSISKKSNIGKT